MSREEATTAVPALRPVANRSVWEVTDTRGEAIIQAAFVDDRLAKIQVGPSSGTDLELRRLAPQARGIRLADPTSTARNAFPGGSMSRVYIAPDADEYIVTDRTGRVLRFRSTWTKPINQDGIGSISVEDATLTLTDEARSDTSLWMR